MKAISLFKLQTLVLLLLCTPLVSSATPPAAPPAPPPPAGTAGANANLTAPTTPPATGTSGATGDDSSDPTDGRPAGNTTIPTWKYLELLNSGQNQGDPCQQQSQSVSDKAQALAQKQNDVLKTQQETESKTLELKQQTETIGLSLVNEGEAYTAKINALVSQLSIKQQAASSKLADDLAKLRQEMLKLNQEASKAKGDIDAASSAIVLAENQREVTCRSAAEAAGDKMEKDLKDKYDAKIAKVEGGQQYINNAGATLAGAKNRRVARRAINVQNAYMTAYKNCLSGTGAAGAGAQAVVKEKVQALNDAQLKYARDMKDLNDAVGEVQKAMAQAEANKQLTLNANEAQAKAEMDAARIEYQTKDSNGQLQIQQISQRADLAARQVWQQNLAVQGQMQQDSAALAKASYIADYCVMNKNPGMRDALRGEACTDPATNRESSARAATCSDSGNPPTRLDFGAPAAPGRRAQ